MPQCPCCNTEVELGVPACPECGLALGGLDDAVIEEEGSRTWPITSEGENEAPVLLHTAQNATDCAMTQSLLNGCGIPTITQTPLPNQFSSVLFGGPILGADIYVPQSRLTEAREILFNSAGDSHSDP